MSAYHAAWLRRNRPALLACGVPDDVLTQPRRWTYLLDHGVDEFNTGWSPEELSFDQARDLLELLGPALQGPPSWGLADLLARRVGGAGTQPGSEEDRNGS